MVCVRVLILMIMTNPFKAGCTQTDSLTDTSKDKDSESNTTAPKGCYYKGKYHHGNWEDGCDYLCTCLDPQTGYYKCRRRCPRYKDLPLNCKLVLPLGGKCCKQPSCLRVSKPGDIKAEQQVKHHHDSSKNTNSKQLSVIPLQGNHKTGIPYRNPDNIKYPKNKPDTKNHTRVFKYNTVNSHTNIYSSVRNESKAKYDRGRRNHVSFLPSQAPLFDLNHEKNMYIDADLRSTNNSKEVKVNQNTNIIKGEGKRMLSHYRPVITTEYLTNNRDQKYPPKANNDKPIPTTQELGITKEENRNSVVVNIIESVEQNVNISDSDTLQQEYVNSEMTLNELENIIQSEFLNISGTTPSATEQDIVNNYNDTINMYSEPDISPNANDTTQSSDSSTNGNGLKDDNDSDNTGVKQHGLENSIAVDKRHQRDSNMFQGLSDLSIGDSQDIGQRVRDYGVQILRNTTQNITSSIKQSVKKRRTEALVGDKTSNDRSKTQTKLDSQKLVVSPGQSKDEENNTSADVNSLKPLSNIAVKNKPIAPTYTGANISLKYKDKEWSKFVKELSDMFLEVSRMKKMKKTKLQATPDHDSGTIYLFKTKRPIITTVMPPVNVYKPRDHFYGNDKNIQDIRKDFTRIGGGSIVVTSNKTGCFYQNRRYNPGDIWKNRCNKTCVCSSDIPGRYMCEQERCFATDEVPPGCTLKTQRTGCCRVLVCPRIKNTASFQNADKPRKRILNTNFGLLENSVKFVRTPTGMLRLQHAANDTRQWVGTFLPSIKNNAKASCHYKNRKYVTGEIWHDGCNSCRCINGMFGRFTCFVRCPSFNNIPSTCSLHMVSAQQCCPILKCSPTSTEVRHVIETSTRKRNTNGRRVNTLRRNTYDNNIKAVPKHASIPLQTLSNPLVKATAKPFIRGQVKPILLNLINGTGILYSSKQVQFNRSKLNTSGRQIKYSDTWQKSSRKRFSRNRPRGIDK